MNSSIQFSVIVPTCGRKDRLQECLRALAPDVQTGTAPYEVIVSDDWYQEESAQQLGEEFPFVQVVAGPSRGPAANRNNGAQHASGQWLVFTDDDCIPDPDWLAAFELARDAEEMFPVLEGRTYAPAEKPSLAYVAPVNETGGKLWSCNFAIKKALFFELGGFDVRFPHAAMEDVDLRYRISGHGVVIRFVPGASVCHPWRSRGSWRKLSERRHGVLLYRAKHNEERKRLSSFHYFYSAAYALVRQTLPEVCGGRVRGLSSALLDHLSLVVLGVQVAIQDILKFRE